MMLLTKEMEELKKSPEIYLWAFFTKIYQSFTKAILHFSPLLVVDTVIL